MRNKKTKALLASLLILAMLLAACTPSAPAPAAPAAPATPAPGADPAPAPAGDNVVQIGLILPMSGLNADQGRVNLDGAQLAVDRINERGGIQSLGGAMLTLVLEDNESDPDRSRMVAERMVDGNPDIVAIHGAAASAFVIPMLPTFERAGVPFITAQTSGYITAQGYEWIFAYAAQSPGFAGAQVGVLSWINETYNTGLSRIGLVYEDTEWGLTNARAARDLIAQIPGFELVYDQNFAPGAADLSPIVMGLMQAEAEVLFPTVYTHDARLLFQTMRQFGYDPIIVGGGGGFVLPEFAAELGPYVDGILSVGSHIFDSATIMNNPQLQNLGAEFEARFGYFMTEQAVGAYGAIYLIAAALENAGSTDRVAFRDAFRALDIAGLTPGGAMGFNEAGWNTNAVAVMGQWQQGPDGMFRTHAVYPPSEATVEFQLTQLLIDIIEAQ